jgi:hypothetical protein
MIARNPPSGPVPWTVTRGRRAGLGRIRYRAGPSGCCGPWMRASTVRAMSMPADTLAAVITVPRSTTRCSVQRAPPVPAVRRVPSQCWPRARRGSRRRPGRSNRCTRGRPGSGGVHLAQPLHHVLAGILLGQAAADDHETSGAVSSARAVAAISGQRPVPSVTGPASAATNTASWPGTPASTWNGPMMSRPVTLVEDERDLHGSVRPLAGTLGAGPLLRLRDGHVLLLRIDMVSLARPRPTVGAPAAGSPRGYCEL